jgi:hypothetical protein
MNEEYEEITVEAGAAAFSNISYKPKWKFSVELEELEGMSEGQIYNHLIEEYVKHELAQDIEMFISNIDEIVEAVENLK